MEEDVFSETRVYINKPRPGYVIFILLGMFVRLFMVYISFPIYFDGELHAKIYINASIIIELLSFIGIVVLGPQKIKTSDMKSKKFKILKEKNTGRYIKDPLFLFPFSNDWICNSNSNLFIVYAINSMIGYGLSFRESLRLMKILSEDLCSLNEWRYWFGLFTTFLCFFWLPYLFDLGLHYFKLKFLNARKMR